MRKPDSLYHKFTQKGTDFEYFDARKGGKTTWQKAVN
nr:MAG TPA: hypothetical protein [Caudoviricetes sp.]